LGDRDPASQPAATHRRRAQRVATVRPSLVAQRVATVRPSPSRNESQQFAFLVAQKRGPRIRKNQFEFELPFRPARSHSAEPSASTPRETTTPPKPDSQTRNHHAPANANLTHPEHRKRAKPSTATSRQRDPLTAPSAQLPLPKTFETIPSPGAMRPEPGCEISVAHDVYSAAGTARRSEGTARPNEGTARRSEGTARPNEGTARPNGGTARPNGGTARPNGGTARPNGGTARPNGGTTFPSWGQRLPDRGKTGGNLKISAREALLAAFRCSRSLSQLSRRVESRPRSRKAKCPRDCRSRVPCGSIDSAGGAPQVRTVLRFRRESTPARETNFVYEASLCARGGSCWLVHHARSTLLAELPRFKRESTPARETNFVYEAMPLG